MFTHQTAVIDTLTLCGWTDMIGYDISRLLVGKCVCLWEKEVERKGVHDISAEECDVLEVMWNTAGTLNNLQKGYRGMTRKQSGHVSGQKACLCWQHPFQSIHNSHSSTSWEPYSLSAQFKGLRPHRKRHIDVTDQSIESHCWQLGHEEAILWGCELRGKLPPGSAVVINRNHILMYLTDQTFSGLLF